MSQRSPSAMTTTLRRSRRPRFAAAWLAPLLALTLAVDARADDILQKGAKTSFKGSVLSEDINKVKYKLDGVAQAQEIDSAAVAEIRYDDAPEAYTQGRDQLKKGDFENAANSFRLASR